MLERIKRLLTGDSDPGHMRLSVVMPVETYEKIQALQRLAECTSTALLLKKALTLYQFALEHSARDGRVIFRHADGSETELEV